MHATVAFSLTFASLALAQTEVENSSTQTNPIEVTASRGPTDDTPNLSDASALSTTIDFSDVPTASITDNVIPGCQTVTAAGEPIFSIQTDTVLETGCTYTVYTDASSVASGSTVIVTPSSTATDVVGNGTSIVTGGPGTATGNAANITSISVGEGLPSSESTISTGPQASVTRTTTGTGSASSTPAQQTNIAGSLEMGSAALELVAIAAAAVLL